MDKILLVSEEPVSSPDTPFPRGGALFIYYLARELAKEHKIAISAARGSDTSLKDAGVEMHSNLVYTARYHLLVRMPFLLYNLLRVYLTARAVKPDVLFAKNTGVFLPTYLAGKMLNKKVACGVGSMPYAGFNRRFAQHVLGYKWDVVYASGSRLKEFCEKHSNAPVVDIGNAVDLDLFQPGNWLESRKKLRLPLKTRLLVYAGSFEPVKRLPELIKWFTQAKSSNTILLLVGDGPDRKKIMSEAGDNVLFKESIEYMNMPYLYNAASAFVLNSESEGIPRSVVESLACRTPVLIHKPAGEYYHRYDTKGIVYYSDPAEFSEKLNLILNKKTGFDTNFISEDFTWDKVAARFTQPLLSS
ncbi:MAG: hypothetical protein B6U97_00990 [Candidatus Altiarchaeales archaeon ex4484_96]|nr:MAG: hypothetical protein B6U97_00990 [Candidatus Altiarchaeales archaeon ex4484_96]